MLARTPSLVRHALRGEDCEATLRIAAQLGAVVHVDGEHVVLDPRPLAQPTDTLDCGNSGTTMRLLAGVLASEPGLRATLVGDQSLSRRPMRRIVEPLRQMGAEIKGDTPPLTIEGRRLGGTDYVSPVASAQVKSCLLLAGARAEGETWVTEPAQSRDHTERMMTALGVELNTRGPGTVGIKGGQAWDGFEFFVPSDVSSAAFLMCAAALVPDSRVLLQAVGTNPTRTGVLESLAAAGAEISVLPIEEQMGEPLSHIEVAHSSLQAFEIGGDLVPRLIDEIPVLAVLATQCEGTTRVRDAAELRVKESDRIETVVRNLAAMGADIVAHEEGFDVMGPTPLHGTKVDARGDHRIGMAFAVAGLVAEGETEILNAESISTSYPGFESDLRSLAERT
jgi:3-phosphoshikimate 1-carboxyvinyltransferase